MNVLIKHFHKHGMCHVIISLTLKLWEKEKRLVIEEKQLLVTCFLKLNNIQEI